MFTKTALKYFSVAMITRFLTMMSATNRACNVWEHFRKIKEKHVQCKICSVVMDKHLKKKDIGADDEDGKSPL